MFDFAFSELLVIGVVALIVIGPEKLPKVARTAGILLGRAQRYVSDVKTDISRQIQLEELKALQEQMNQQARALEGSIKKEVQATETALNQTAQGVAATLEGAAREVKDAVRGTTAADDTLAALTAAPTPPEPEEIELYHPDKEQNKPA
jgi:sec-independent protein translocase protein TatB